MRVCFMGFVFNFALLTFCFLTLLGPGEIGVEGGSGGSPLPP